MIKKNVFIKEDSIIVNQFYRPQIKKRKYVGRMYVYLV